MIILHLASWLRTCDLCLLSCLLFQIQYVSGSYDTEEGFQLLDKEISKYEYEQNRQEGISRRLFYLALPPSVYPPVCRMIRRYCMNKCEFNEFSAE